MKVEHENSVDDIISEVSKIGFKASLNSNDRQSNQTPQKKEGYGYITLSGILILLGFIDLSRVFQVYLPQSYMLQRCL